jgi:hypothetical protein
LSELQSRNVYRLARLCCRRLIRRADRDAGIADFDVSPLALRVIVLLIVVAAPQ